MGFPLGYGDTQTTMPRLSINVVCQFLHVRHDIQLLKEMNVFLFN